MELVSSLPFEQHPQIIGDGEFSFFYFTLSAPTAVRPSAPPPTVRDFCFTLLLILCTSNLVWSSVDLEVRP
ncbi:hypothetical protein GQ457_07G018340 [Hibiscus cannabinus]